MNEQCSILPGWGPKRTPRRFSSRAIPVEHVRFRLEDLEISRFSNESKGFKVAGGRVLPLSHPPPPMFLQKGGLLSYVVLHQNKTNECKGLKWKYLIQPKSRSLEVEGGQVLPGSLCMETIDGARMADL